MRISHNIAFSGVTGGLQRGSAPLMYAYQSVLAVSAALCVWSLWDLHDLAAAPWVLAALGAAGLVGERARVRIAPNVEVSISLLPTVLAAALLGPTVAAIVGGVSYLGQFPAFMPEAAKAKAALRGSPHLKWGIYTSIRTLNGGVAGLVALQVGALAGGSFSRIALAATAATFAAELLDQAFAAVTYFLRGGSPTETLAASAPAALASISLYVPVVAMLGLAYEQLSPWTLPLLLAPTVAVQRLFVLYQDQSRLSSSLSGANDQLERANLSFATALVATLDARDRYTAGHSNAVAVYARDIAARMGLTEQERRMAHLCGLVHDIGKIGLPAGLLEKPGALTLEERRQMEHHSAIGERILANVEAYGEIAGAVRHHHERIDGQGYPDGLLADDIPLIARVIAVADAYNAMTSARPYRDAMPSRVARLRLAQAVESQFDTSVVAAFEAILASSSEEYRTARSSEFGFSSPAVRLASPEPHVWSVPDELVSARLNVTTA